MLSDRAELRQAFFDAWARYERQEPLHGADALIIEAALRHPEYHPVLRAPERYHEREWQPELGTVNPFLHLGLHIAVQEQLTMDRPPGIRGHYEALCARLGDAHEAQHQVMDCLAEALWQAQRDHKAPDDVQYLYCVAHAARGAHA
ncbi:MAG TPA: DUF1841 family protein [Acidiferrobacteraceae bacterium]|nr:DUF1841 family protein [Acidiferrobacteraceae bacterium]